MATTVKLPSEAEMREMLFNRIYGKWISGNCENYVAGWTLHTSLFDSALKQAGKTMSETELVLFGNVAVSVAVQDVPEILHSLLYGIMGQILGAIVNDSQLSIRLEKSFSKQLE